MSGMVLAIMWGQRQTYIAYMYIYIYVAPACDCVSVYVAQACDCLWRLSYVGHRQHEGGRDTHLLASTSRNHAPTCVVLNPPLVVLNPRPLYYILCHGRQNGHSKRITLQMYSIPMQLKPTWSPFSTTVTNVLRENPNGLKAIFWSRDSWVFWILIFICVLFCFPCLFVSLFVCFCCLDYLWVSVLFSRATTADRKHIWSSFRAPLWLNNGIPPPQ